MKERRGSKPSSPTRLVNLDSGKVVEKPGRVHYGIASYVWKDWSDPTQVVREATSILKEAGIRWLWIDQKCIDQSDPKDQAKEIPRMGEYYSNAALVLAMVTGVHLPSSSFEINPGDYDEDEVEELSEAGEKIEASRWNSRVWTFQEAALNKNTMLICDNGYISTAECSVLFLLNRKRVAEAIRLSGSGYDDRSAWSCKSKHGNKFLGSLSENAHALTGDVSFSGRADEIPKLWALNRDRECTKEEDQVYAYLGMLWEDNDVKIEYGIGLAEACRRTFRCSSPSVSLLDSRVARGKNRSWLPRVSSQTENKLQVGSRHCSPAMEEISVDKHGGCTVEGWPGKVSWEENDKGVIDRCCLDTGYGKQKFSAFNSAGGWGLRSHHEDTEDDCVVVRHTSDNGSHSLLIVGKINGRNIRRKGALLMKGHARLHHKRDMFTLI